MSAPGAPCHVGGPPEWRWRGTLLARSPVTYWARISLMLGVLPLIGWTEFHEEKAVEVFVHTTEAKILWLDGAVGDLVEVGAEADYRNQ